MMTCSIIQKSQLESAHRLDAEYYQPEYLGIIKNLDKLKAVPIKEVAKNPKRKFNPKTGEAFQYIEISEIDLTTGEYNKSEILGENTPDRAQWVVKQNDVIVSTVRPIRNAVSLINKDIKNLVCSSGFAVLEAEKIEPEYLFVWLKSQPIVNLLDRQTTATMYPAVTTDDILNTKIYLADENFRQQIKNKVIESQKELEKSKSLYSQAEDLLLQELGLKDFKPQEDLSYVVNLSDVKSAQRVDAEYFQPKYERLVKALCKDRQPLKIIAKRKTKKVDVFTENDYKYIEISDVDVGSGEVTFNIMKGSDLPANAKIEIKGGELIVSKVRPTRGAVGIIPDNWNANFIASGAFSVFEVPLPTREHLKVVLRSIIGKLQLEKPTTGSSYPTIDDEDVEDLFVPIIPKTTQQKIADLVRQSHEARKKAKDLLEQAKKKVEELIEK